MASERHPRWYFGGIAAVEATAIIQPLDLIKVTMQVQNFKMKEVVPHIFKIHGIQGFYNGISASMVRQMAYSTLRFGIYHVGEEYVDTKTFSKKIQLAGFSGFAGGFVCTPADIINVRLQNDVVLQPPQRRNYKHVFDGLLKVYRIEGFSALFTGSGASAIRGAVMTIGQLAFYEELKKLMLKSSYFQDSLLTHFTTSLIAGFFATVLTQPIDVIKTRAMNAKPGMYNGTFDIIRQTAKSGPLGFFKGFIPAFLKLGPQTVLTFIFLEQLRLNFGYIKAKPENS